MRRLLVGSLLAVAVLLPPSASGFAPPTTTISAGPARATSSGSATFTFSASDPSAVFACALDDGAFALCSSPQTYTGLADGRHRFFVIAIGVGGAELVPASWVWTVDRVAPGQPRQLRAQVGYGRLRLAWTLGAASDAVRVVVLRSTDAKQAATTRVYQGNGSSYTDTHFVNDAFHRYSVVAYDEAGNQSRAAVTLVPASALLRAPSAGARVTRPPELRWKAVRRATYYNVQLYRGATKVLSAWPIGASQRLSRSWSYGGRRHTLRRGLYTWYVWPGLGARSRGVYGPALGQSSFRVA